MSLTGTRDVVEKGRNQDLGPESSRFPGDLHQIGSWIRGEPHPDRRSQSPSCILRKCIHLDVGRGHGQSEREVVRDAHRCPRLEASICGPHHFNHLPDHRAVDLEVAHKFPDRGQKLVEAEGKEEGTEAVALRDAIFQEARAQGSQPTCAVVVAAACGIRPIEEVERR